MACRVSAEKSADSLMGIPLYVICCFSLADFTILSLSLIFVVLISIILVYFFLVNPVWNSKLPGLVLLFNLPS